LQRFCSHILKILKKEVILSWKTSQLVESLHESRRSLRIGQMLYVSERKVSDERGVVLGLHILT